YVVLFPAVIYYPYVGKVHVHLMDLDEPVRVSLHLESSQEAPNMTVEQQGSGILQLNWPRFTNVRMYEIAKMHISIQGDSLQVYENRSVLVDAMELGTFVQTDKDIYKPGETVRFRIVRLDHNFIPSNTETVGPHVQDPTGNPVAQWREASPRQGIVDLSLSLAAEPVLGTYSIEVEKKTHHFSVVDSGLPHFDILIRLPRVVTEKDEKIPLDVCGRYPSGKTFRGRVEVRLCQFRESIRSPEESARVCAECRGQTGRDSCFSTQVPANYFNLTSFEFYGWLHAYASLQEEGTGMWHTAAKSCEIVPGKPTITFEHPDRFYKPGIPYTGTGEVRLSEDEDKAYLYNGIFCLSVYPFISGSKSFLKIRSVAKELPCGQPQQLWVDYFFSEKAPGIKLQNLEVVLLVS
ncbi:A2ML1 protein, partial [Trogon melanurus]|nr:A2ML1 protein [Trogon melanurus]